MDDNEIDLTGLAHMVKTKKVSPVELVRHYLEVIDKKDGEIKAWVTVLEDQAIEQAKSIEQKIMAGEDAGSLAGVPFSVKDIFFYERDKNNLWFEGFGELCAE